MATPPSACDTTNTRTSRELHAKFVVVNITVLGAYAHLLHLRNDRVLWRLVLFFFFPLTETMYTGIAFSIMLGYILTGQTGRKRASRIYNTLFGRLPDNDTLLDDDNLADEDSLLRQGRLSDDGNLADEGSLRIPNGLAPPTSQRQSPSTYARARRWAGLLIMLSQSITTLYLFDRRRQHEAVSEYDLSILCLAIGCFTVTIMSLLHVAFEPKCSANEAYRRPCMLLRVGLPRSQGSFAWMAAYGYFLILIAVTGYLKSSFAREVICDTLLFMPYAFPVVGLIIFGISTLYMFDTRKHFSLGERAMSVAESFCVGWLGTAAMFISCFGPMALVGGLVEFPRLLLFEFPGFSSVDPATPCPRAWKDPVGDWVWWLA